MERRSASRLLLIALVLHNGEEALTYAAGRVGATRLAQAVWPGAQLPPAAAMYGALVIVTLAAGALLLWAGETRRDRLGWLVVRATALVLLANVMVPHVPAAVALGGYAPGVITAVAVNLPLAVWILTRRSGTAG